MGGLRCTALAAYGCHPPGRCSVSPPYVSPAPSAPAPAPSPLAAGLAPPHTQEVLPANGPPATAPRPPARPQPDQPSGTPRGWSARRGKLAGGRVRQRRGGGGR